MHAVPGDEIRKVQAADPVMPAGEPERGQLAGAYPPQDSGVADTAALGDKTYRDIFRSPLLRCLLQANLPMRAILSTGLLFTQLELSAYLVLAVFESFVVYESTVTGKSHGDGKSSQINHKDFTGVFNFLKTGKDNKREYCEYQEKFRWKIPGVRWPASLFIKGGRWGSRPALRRGLIHVLFPAPLMLGVIPVGRF